MNNKKWKVVLGVAAALAVAVAATVRNIMTGWSANVDPLEGEPVAFPPAEKRFVELPDGAEIATYSTGAGPTIVCVHGLTGSHNDWGPMVPALVNAGYRVLAIDQRGHGDSSGGTAGYGSKQLGQDLGHVLQDLDIDAVALLGHSMGGMAAMAYAVDNSSDFQKRVGSLVLIGTAASLKVAGSALAFRLSGISIPDRLRPAQQRLRLGAGLTVFGAAPSLHMIDEAIASASSLPEAVRAAATSALGSHNVLDRITEVRCPTLVIGGTRDRLIRPRQVQELAEAIPGAELQMIASAGHMLIWERHSEIVDLITEFIARRSTIQGGRRSTLGA